MVRKLVLSLIAVLGVCAFALAQNRQVTGTVVDAQGNPVVGASVMLAGSTTGVSTVASGAFSINAPANGTLVISFIGYETQQIALAGKTNITVTMVEDATAIETVTIVGYGSGNKVGSAIGSVAQVKGEALENRPTANVVDALQGKVAGLQVYTSSGEPTATSSMRLHGVGSLEAGTAPLVLLDGAPVDAGVLVSLNGNDIESYNILKDASATSIYGARAANGVIYVTTKKGRRNQDAIVTLNAQYGISQPATFKFEMMNGMELADYQYKYGAIPRATYDKIHADNINTNWRKYFFNTSAPNYQVDLSVSGGSERTSYYISGMFMDQKGTDPGSGVHKYSIRSNVETQANKWMKFGMNLSLGADTRHLAAISRNSAYRNNFNNASFASVMTPTYASPYAYNPETGKYDGPELDRIPYIDTPNPIVFNRVNTSVTNVIQFNGTAFVQLTPFKNFNIKSQLGGQFWNSTNKSQSLASNPFGSGTGSVSRSNGFDYTFTYTNTMDYQWTLNEKHNFYILAGQESVQYRYDTFGASRAGQTDDRLMTLSNGTAQPTVSDGMSEYAFNSGFGRVEYNYDRKYYVDASVRYDASSRFGRNNRGATFYAFGAMWDAKREAFFADVDAISSFKVRTSYGTQGNADIANFAALGLTATNIYGGKSGMYLGTMANTELGWETQKLFTFGVSAGFWRDRLTVDVEFYNRVTEDMLMTVPLPATSGYAEAAQNIGSMFNRGVDLAVTGDLVRTKDWFVQLRANVNYNRNRITKIFNGYDEYPRPNFLLNYAVGHDSGEFYCETFLGVDPADGMQMWVGPDDAAGNPTVTKDYNESVPELQGVSRYAPWSGGFGLTATWKGISVIANFSWNYGKYLINNDRFFTEVDTYTSYSRSKWLLDRWEKPGDISNTPKFGQNIQFDSHLMEDASFIRLKDLTVGYDFPKTLLAKTGFLKGVRIYFTARNLLTFTSYTGFDPEIDSNLALGLYPNSRQFVGGLQFTF